MAPISRTRAVESVSPPETRAGTVSSRVARTLATASPSRPGQRAPVRALSRMYAAHAAPASSANSDAGHRQVGRLEAEEQDTERRPAAPRPGRAPGASRATARVSGPMNSMVTAMPSGIREKDW